MWPYFLLLIATAVAGPTDQRPNCTFSYDGAKYTRSSILTIKGLPTNLAYDSAHNNLLFTLIDVESLQNDNEQTKMDQYILRDGNPFKINDIHGQAAAVDPETERIYIATDDGLHVLLSNDTTSFVSMKDEDIVQLFKRPNKNELYLVTYPENEVSVLNIDENEKRKVEHVPCAFILAVDSKGNIFYECDSKYIKVLLKDFHEPIEFVGIGKNFARAITVDNKDRVILAANDGLYHLKPDSLIPKKLMNLDFVPSGIAIDENKIYLSSNGIIYEYSSEDCYDG